MTTKFTATDLQKIKLEKLMQNIDKPVEIPERGFSNRKFPEPPDFIRNIMGSSAGAGSGEFHVYRHLRRKEFARLRYIEEQAKKEDLDAQYRGKLEANKRKAEELTAKKRAKRLKRKQKMKELRKKKGKNVSESEKTEESESSGQESEPESKSELQEVEQMDKCKAEEVCQVPSTTSEAGGDTESKTAEGDSEDQKIQTVNST